MIYAGNSSIHRLMLKTTTGRSTPNPFRREGSNRRSLERRLQRKRGKKKEQRNCQDKTQGSEGQIFAKYPIGLLSAYRSLLNLGSSFASTRPRPCSIVSAITRSLMFNSAGICFACTLGCSLTNARIDGAPSEFRPQLQSL